MKPGSKRGRLAGIVAVAALAPACTVSPSTATPPAAVRIACTTLPVARAPVVGTSGPRSRLDMPPVPGALGDVAARSPGSALAVGFAGVLGVRERALVARWNGAVWRTLSDPAIPPHSEQSDLAAVAFFPGGAWAVGEYGETYQGDGGGVPRQLIVRVTGTTMRRVPGPGPAYGSLQDVAATSAADAWAGGSTLGGPLLEHWDGTAWTRARLPATVQRRYGFVAGVAATSRTNAWAVIVSDSRQPRIVHWNGRRWTDVVAPAIGMRYDLAGVAAASARDVWAVGAGVILHWNGRMWTCALSRDDVFAVSAPSADNAWAVGGSDTGTLALHWDGHSWKQVMIPQLGSVYSLHGVAVIPRSGRAWAVGDADTKTLMLRWNGTAWR